MCAVSPLLRFGSPACRICSRDIHSFDVLNRSALHPTVTMASADFSQFVVTTANGAACETSRDKSRTFPRLPVRFTQQGYGCLWDFAALCRLILLLRLVIGFLFVGPRFRYGFFSPAPHGAKLASRYRVRRQLRPLGLPPKLRDMPVIQNDGGPDWGPRFISFFIFRFSSASASGLRSAEPAPCRSAYPESDRFRCTPGLPRAPYPRRQCPPA